MQPDEKSFIKVITSGENRALQPSENRITNVLVTSPPSIDDSDHPVVKVKAKESVAELMKRITGIDIERCKRCKVGRLQKTPLLPSTNQMPEAWDTS